MGSSPRVVHCKREPFDVYIGRPSKWGNPFSHLSNTLASYRVATREQSIVAFEAYVSATPGFREAIKRELKGKVLGCWCSPKACHGDVLMRVANGR